jgi:hypothetical protein
VPDRLMGSQRRNFVVATAWLAATVMLSVALFIAVFAWRDSQVDNQDLRRGQEQSTAENACRSRFVNEDARVARAQSNGIVFGLFAEALDDDVLKLTALDYMARLQPALSTAEAERFSSPDLCQRDPAAQPTRHTIPTLPPLPTIPG